MDREIPFDENKVCDCCGAKGALDFMGDCLCPDCCENIMEYEELKELKPCPFCYNTLIATIRTPHGICRVCLSCDARGPMKETKKEATKAWNNRAVAQKTKEVLGIYEEALKAIAGLGGPLTGEDATCFRTWAEEALEAHNPVIQADEQLLCHCDKPEILSMDYCIRCRKDMRRR